MSTLARTRAGRWVLVCLTVPVTVAATARLQDAPVPMALQVSLFERLWTFDRSHEARLEDGLVIGVLYQSRVRSSALAKDAFLSAAASLNTSGPGVRIVEIDYRDPVAFQSALTRERVADVAASFQEAVVDVLVAKCRRALQQCSRSTLCLGGGVAANSRLRQALGEMCRELRVEMVAAPMEYCTDNAAMAAIAWELYDRGESASLDVDVRAGLLRR